MKKRSILYRFLEWIGVIKYEVISKKEMCERAKSVCNGNCETCAWHE